MSSFDGIIAVAIKHMSVTQTKDRVHEHPGKNHGAESQDQMHGQMRLRAGLRAGLVGAQEKANRKQGHRRCDNHANRNQQLANILCLGVRAQPGLRRLQNHYLGQDKHKEGKRVPGGNHS